MLAIVVLTFITFNSADYPLILLFGVVVADIVAVVAGDFIFTLATGAHILSKELINISAKVSRGISQYDTKFWSGMTPLRVEVGNVCTFETKEFLLFIWGQVVILNIINLLIAY